MRSTLSGSATRLSDFWHRVMTVTVDEGIAWQQKRPPILKATIVILFAIIWMAIGYLVSGIIGRLLARRDRRLN